MSHGLVDFVPAHAELVESVAGEVRSEVWDREWRIYLHDHVHHACSTNTMLL